MKELSDKQIIAAWEENVQPWIAAIENNEIQSRVLVTNQAIIDAVTERKPTKVLDLGCGEAWLARELVESGIDVLGVDAVPEFIASAQQHNIGRYKVIAYEDLSYDVLQETFDVVVCNFSLIGGQAVSDLFQQIPALLNEAGAFLVQTIHPLTACGDDEYEDGWREGSWAGFSDKFSHPAPWYFRTIESWKSMFEESGFTLTDIREPVNTTTNDAASIIFIAEVNKERHKSAKGE